MAPASSIGSSPDSTNSSNSSPPSTPSSSALFVSALSGAAIAGIALHYATRGRFFSHASAPATDHAVRQLLETTLRHNHDAMIQHVQHGLSESTSQMKSSLLSQQTALQQSLHPVAAATQQLSHMQNDVSTLKNVLLHAPTTRGRSPLFGGEFQLEALLRHALPVGHYQMQYTFQSNHKRVDGMVQTPMGKLAIDCKFPLGDTAEALSAAAATSSPPPGQHDEEQEEGAKQQSLPETVTSAAPEAATTKTTTTTSTKQQKKIQTLLHKHMDDIAKKYIIPGETVDYAILFLPTEAVLLHVLENDANSKNNTLILHAHRKRVYLACPTTLLLLLTQLYGSSSSSTSIGATAEDAAQHRMVLQQRVQTLLADTDRLVKRFHDTDKALQKATAELAKMQISMAKIEKTGALLQAEEGWTTSLVANSNGGNKATATETNDTTKNASIDTIPNSTETGGPAPKP